MMHARDWQPQNTSMTVDQLIERIVVVAPALRREVLVDFAPAQLAHYLQHLEAVESPRDRHARWERDPGVKPACERGSRF
jgi:hypothetical protein